MSCAGRCPRQKAALGSFPHHEYDSRTSRHRQGQFFNFTARCMRRSSVFIRPEGSRQQTHPIDAARNSLHVPNHSASAARDSYSTEDEEGDEELAYGRQVTLTLQAPSGGGAREVKLTRQPITFNPVTSDLCGVPAGGGAKTGYIRIATFSKQTPDGVRAAIKSLRVHPPSAPPPPPPPPHPAVGPTYSARFRANRSAYSLGMGSGCEECGRFVIQNRETHNAPASAVRILQTAA